MARRQRRDEDYEELSRQGPQAVMDYGTRKAIPEIFRTLHSVQPNPMLTEAVLWEFWGGNSQGASSTKAALKAVEGLARAQSSSRWGAGTALLAARFARRFSRLYVYRYNQHGVDLHGRLFNFTGAVHGTDLVTLLGDAMLLQVCRRPANPVEQRMTTVMRRYFVNFINFGSPAPESEWPRYRAGEAYIHNIQDAPCGNHVEDRHVAFWLQYLPHLVGIVASADERTEQLSLTGGEGRLRGGVFALCGVSALLLLLLGGAAAMLRWERRRRHAADSYDTN